MINRNAPEPTQPEPTQPEDKPQGNWWIVGTVVALALAPLLFVQGEYGGADGAAQDAVGEIQPDYQPWAAPVINLPSSEVESFLFGAQAAIGAGILGYVIGVYKGRRDRPNP